MSAATWSRSDSCGDGVDDLVGRTRRSSIVRACGEGDAPAAQVEEGVVVEAADGGAVGAAHVVGEDLAAMVGCRPGRSGRARRFWLVWWASVATVPGRTMISAAERAAAVVVDDALEPLGARAPCEAA